MDLAYSVSDCVIARAGAATVSELTGLGIPTIFVPYPVGNGEQVRNASDVIAAGGAVLCRDEDFTPEYISATVIPLLADRATLDHMSSAALGLGIRDGSERMVALIAAALSDQSGGSSS
jgi:UDP-N-acetylglucosamine--N-acetylmuramyl-(pentapeptide) pyrophosphoryl-undecaprenol N-acetylglucosamine transferase